MPYSVVDLFAGAGGLSLGFTQTGKYEIKVAFEKEPHMQATYRRNHPTVELQGDVCGADYEDIQRRYGAIDVVIGGPPCQGFSNANRQKNHAISQNNMLVKQYIRAIRELKPKAFVMENVSMLRSDVHRFYMEEADLGIVEKYQIPNKNTPLYLLDAEFMFDGALEIVQNLELLQQRLWPEKHYWELNVIYKGEKNGLLANIHSFAVFDYLKSILTSGEDGYVINSGVLCAADFGAPQKRERFVVMGIKKKHFRCCVSAFKKDQRRTL